MTPQEILMLIKAGYTKADIDAMAASKPEAKQEDPTQDEPAAPEEHNDEPAEQSVEERFAAINQTLDKMVKTMERMAIRNSSQPETKERSPEDVLASIEAMYK